MSRRTKRQDNLLKEQPTVAMIREERNEQRELAGRKKTEAARVKNLRIGPPGQPQSLADLDLDPPLNPPKNPKPSPRIARPGKPLKRP
jgi:hypothetical protein